jgi:cyclopropane fatty-acyl-phospholipid synthase-like methyltransferase
VLCSSRSKLSLEGYLNIDIHYAETLREWRRRFNANLPVVKSQGFDDIFIRQDSGYGGPFTPGCRGC